MRSKGRRQKAEGRPGRRKRPAVNRQSSVVSRQSSRVYALAERVGKALKSRNLMLVTAESCTGGWIAQAVTMVPGSSDWVERGCVPYTYSSKREVLGVKDGNAGAHGVGREPAVRERA